MLIKPYLHNQPRQKWYSPIVLNLFFCVFGHENPLFREYPVQDIKLQTGGRVYSDSYTISGYNNKPHTWFDIVLCLCTTSPNSVRE